MKPLLISLILLCNVQNVFALIKANPQDYADINAVLRVAKEKEDAIAETINEREKALRKKQVTVAELLNESIKELKRESKNAHEQALWLTIRAYDIIPFADNIPMLDEGNSVLLDEFGKRPKKEKPIKWLPIFDEAGPKRVKIPGIKQSGIRIITPDVAGNTASDGISRIFPGAFSSPEELASIVIYEQHHFIQNITPGESDQKTTAELEVAAYERELEVMDTLGFSGDRKLLQEQRLTEILDGKRGVRGKKDEIGKRQLAREQRAYVERSRGGIPLPEPSLDPLSEDKIKSLVEEAKGQIAIAQRAHDDRLRDAVIALSQRSCANPGSVSGAELLALPRAHFVFYWTTGGPQSCFDEYKYIAEGGTDPMALRSLSTPPPNAQVPPPAFVPAPLRPVAPPLLSSIYPQLRDFAIAACRDINRVPDISRLYGHYLDYRTPSDENLSRNLMTGMDDCAQQIFNQAIAKTRAANGYFVLSREWAAAIVAANAAKPRGSNPPSGGTPPGGPPPERKHPDIVFPKPPWQKNIKALKLTKHEK